MTCGCPIFENSPILVCGSYLIISFQVTRQTASLDLSQDMVNGEVKK